MSSMPPNMPPYDPKTQWRIYREQQKAAWRAQRDAWKAQRHVWKAGYGGAWGPRVPSIVGPVLLIGVGIISLLVLTGHISASQFWGWYAHWWPLLLIIAGLALLAEWAIDLRRPTPVRRGGSFVGIIILLAFLGFGAAGWDHFSGVLHDQFGENGNDFFNSFGKPEHDSDQQVLHAQMPANGTIDIENPRGDVSVTAGDGSEVEVQAHAVAFADSDSGAQKIFAAEAPQLTTSGGVVLVKSEGNNNGKLNLTVTVPKTAKVTINASRGDVTAAGLGAGINVSASHGDTHLNSITGQVQAHFANGRHDFSAHQINGDLDVEGNSNDITLSELKGRVTLNGEIFGDVHMENISGGVKLRTSVTELDLAALPGDMTLDSDDLRVTEAQGAVRVVTHAKDVDLSQIYGDSYVDNRDGTISIEPAGPYAVEAKNSKGDVELTLPPNAAGTVDGRAHNGDIVSDFSLTITGEEDKTVSGKIGAGGPRIQLSSDNGDVHIKKGPAFPPAPPAPPAPPGDIAAPHAPHSAPHLKAPKAAPEEPVTQ